MKTNIRKLREKAGLTQAQLGAPLGWDQGRISHYENGRRTPDLNDLEALAGVLGVKVGDLIDEPGPRPDKNVSEVTEPIRNIPVISWVQAGEWSEIIDNYHPGHGEGYVKTTKKTGPNTFALRVVGDSMEPVFPQGSTIIVDPSVDARAGSYVIVRLEGTQEATFKQLVVEGGSTYLKPLNPRYPIMQVNGEATICGVVVQLVMDF